MNSIPIPCFQGEPILDHTPRQAFRIDPEAIIDSIKQQFSHRCMCFRELGQNSADSGCTMIDIEIKYEPQQGIMVVSFRDNGCAMTLDVIKRHYLCLFDSSKEEILEAVGEFSLGRLSMFCYELTRLELITMPSQGTAYAVLIEPDLSGSVYEVPRQEGVRLIGEQHGTIVCMKIPVSGPKAFAEEVKTINKRIRKELCWITPSIHQTKVELQENGELKYSREKVNTSFGVPGEYTIQDKQGNAQVMVKMASGLGEATLSAGLSSSGTKTLSPITLCIGKIPVERPAGLPWTGQESFALRELHIILDSFYFKTNIGRNRITLDTPFVKELLPKIFQHVILNGLVRSSAILLTKRPLETYQHRKTIQIMLADVLVKSQKHKFSVPEEVLKAPFIPSYVSSKPYCLSFLDEWDKEIFFTWERPSSISMHNLLMADEPDIVCICLADLPYDFQSYIEDRYQGRIRRKENRIYVNDSETPEALEYAGRIEKKLKLRTNWPKCRRGIDNTEQLPQHLDLRIGVFCSYSGTEDKITPTYYIEEPLPTIYLNKNNPHIQNLLELLLKHSEYQKPAAHFLMREILCDENLAPPARQREAMLTTDLIYRFNTPKMPWEEEQEDEDTEISSLMEIFEEIIRL
ncbi:hypothetical protein SAMN02746065_12013 [Desulfocicer vacuolatum DSM 3385]|uniref:Histidine kinase-, DNA gyrase B-, and HSP90-like ATPase n=1 Tax=Desulfocicer vacuolatum DSM 3385 TaxID=1121400 RepID=A0A1W2DT82_9BACT|nr:hypothetical protein [Desulfocicer vacuolatum]SMD00258.1 hypothetical protein SAMN02746065_12013 [Desulfocicer vacuolatum DSM 3385]